MATCVLESRAPCLCTAANTRVTPGEAAATEGNVAARRGAFPTGDRVYGGELSHGCCCCCVCVCERGDTAPLH